MSKPLERLEAARWRSGAAPRDLPSASNSGAPIVARRPGVARPPARVASGCQYMSQKRVVPVRIISTQARRVPQ